MDINDIILPLHLFILALTAWNIVLADHMAFSWIRGKVNMLRKEETMKYHKRMWIGLIGMIITGVMMFWPMREFLLTRPQFYVKMLFVLGLVANGFVIGKLQHVATKQWYKELTLKEKVPLFISGAVSTLCWLGAAVGGFYLIPDY